MPARPPFRADRPRHRVRDLSRRLAALGAAAALAACSGPQPTAPTSAPAARGDVHRVSVTDLGTLGEGVTSYAYDVNRAGQVVGYSTTDGINSQTRHAFLWQHGQMRDLGTLDGGSWSEARGINASGQVTGLSANESGLAHAFLWQHGTMTSLGTLGGAFSEAFAINRSGEVVGMSPTRGGEIHAFLWSNGSMTDLGTLGGANSEAYAINAAGDVAGWSETADGSNHAFLWHDGVMEDLGALADASESRGAGIGPRGEVVGDSWTGQRSLATHAFLFQNDEMTGLEGLGGPVSQAKDMDRRGRVVGFGITSDNQAHAILWSAGTAIDLGTLPGGFGSQAMAIDAAGDIAGWRDNGRFSHAVLWTVR